jgi:hypothetical protein
MKRNRFSKEQIIAILGEQEAGSKTAEVCRRDGVSEATFRPSTRGRPSTAGWKYRMPDS